MNQDDKLRYFNRLKAKLPTTWQVRYQLLAHTLNIVIEKIPQGDLKQLAKTDFMTDRHKNQAWADLQLLLKTASVYLGKDYDAQLVLADNAIIY